MKSKVVIVMALLLISVFCWIACIQSTDSGNHSLPDQISYNFHIRPILSDKCFKCHGPDVNKRQGQFRLDIADSAFAPLKETKGAFALVAGKPDQSELYKRVSSTDTSFIMPPPDSHLSALTPFEIKLIKKWIEQGAKVQ